MSIITLRSGSAVLYVTVCGKRGKCKSTRIARISIPRNELLNKIKTSNTDRLPPIVTYNRTIPDLQTIIDKNWHILQIEPKLKEIFVEPAIFAFKRNKKP